MDTFRKEYRKLDPDEVALMSDLKRDAEDLLRRIEGVPDGRCQALAKTKLEECVMWAVKGITG